MILSHDFFKELARLSEEAPPVAPQASDSQAPAQSLSPGQPSRTEETERPAERQLPLELPPEPCKVPLHIPKSNSMLDSLPMTHISTTLAGGFRFFHFSVNSTTCLALGSTFHEPPPVISTISISCSVQKYLLHRPASSYRSKSPWRFLW